MKLRILFPSFITLFIVIVKLDDVSARKLIKYNDKWSSDDVLRTSLYEPDVPEFDYDQIPLEDLRNLIESNSVLRNRLRAKQDQAATPAKPFTIASLLAFLFGGATTTTTTVAPTTATTLKTSSTTSTTTTQNPADMTLGTRTRRPTKYKPKGNCKNPPKKHYKEDLEDQKDDKFKTDFGDDQDVDTF